MGKPKIKPKRRAFTLKDIQKLKDTAVLEEGLQLELECKEIFGSDYAGVVLKLIDLDMAVEDDPEMQNFIILDRHDLYTIILDNSIEEIIEYYKEKIITLKAK